MTKKYSKEELQKMDASELEQAVQEQSSGNTSKGSSLSTEQMALLNTLTYLNINFESGKTLGELIENEKSNEDEWDDLLSSGGYTDRETVEDVIEAVANDKELSSLKVGYATEYEQEEGKPVSVCFLNEDSKEAIVAYRGTNDYEWMDNADAFLQEESKLQKEAVEFLKDAEDACNLEDKGYDITVTGHSKGGNKAQYAAVMSNEVEVDNCYSFDGQGFSKEFVVEHFDKIVENRGKITTHAADEDYVNGLGIDIAGEHVFHDTDKVELFEGPLGLISIEADVAEVTNGFNPLSHSIDYMYNIEDGKAVMNGVVEHRNEFTQNLHETCLGMMELPVEEQEECFKGMMGIFQGRDEDNNVSESSPESWGVTASAIYKVILYYNQYVNEGEVHELSTDEQKTADNIRKYCGSALGVGMQAIDLADDVKEGIGDFTDDPIGAVNEFLGDAKEEISDFANDVGDYLGF